MRDAIGNMTIPATQLAAYERLKSSGALARSQWEVYDLLTRSPGLTRNEVDLAIGHGRPNANASRRLVEMVRLGVLRRGPSRRCTVTNRACETWFVTGAAEVTRPAKKAKATGPTIVEAFSTLSKLLRHPRAKLLPDATIDAALSIVDGVERA